MRVLGATRQRRNNHLLLLPEAVGCHQAAAADAHLGPGPHPCPPLPAAPEQLLNGRVGLPSDVFSLGLLLHDLCTGEQPALVSSAEGRACWRRPLQPGQVGDRVALPCQDGISMPKSRWKRGEGLVHPGV